MILEKLGFVLDWIRYLIQFKNLEKVDVILGDMWLALDDVYGESAEKWIEYFPNDQRIRVLYQ